MKRLALWLWAVAAWGQQVPVVLLNGYQGDCGESTAAATFGEMQTLLERDGWRVYFFDNCAVTAEEGKPAIEELGVAFGEFLRRNGLETVDVVAHSMGGLIVRAHVAGMLPGGRGFAPAERHGIRKAVFLATPHHGVLAQAATFTQIAPDAQLVAMFQGSRFLWELGRWNQGTADLRGVDALAVAGAGGAGGHDGAVSTMSAAFVAGVGAGRAVITPDCHQEQMPFFWCRGDGVAYATGTGHRGYRIVRSFLAGENEWASLGLRPGGSILAGFGGLHLRYRDAANRAGGERVTFTYRGRTEELLFNGQGGFFADRMPVGEYSFRLAGVADTGSFGWRAKAGEYAAVLWKAGPRLERVFPAPPLVGDRLTAGMEVVIRGTGLEGGSWQIGGRPLAVTLVSAEEVRARLPEGAAGAFMVGFTGAAGAAEIRILVEGR